MGEKNLQLLTFGVAARVDPDFRAGRATSIDLDRYLQPFARVVDLRPFNTVVDEAMNQFPRKDADQSDGWLAPRLHHVLRLRRNEAAEHGVWLYLAIAARPDYVVWRWGPADETDDPARLERFTGSEIKHAFARLWWMAELFRNSSDYAPVVQAMSFQDIPNNLFRLNIAHHRPTVQGALATLFPDGKPLPRLGDNANALAKAANAVSTTLQIDLLAPDVMLDEAAAKAWIQTADDIDAVAVCADLPQGPDDPPVPQESVDTMTELMTTLLSEAPLRVRRGGNNGEGDQPDDSGAATEAIEASSSDGGPEPEPVGA